MPISSYSTTPSNNNAAPPNGFPEGMAPASLNDGMRQVMADIRTWYQNPAWIDLGDTPTFSSGTVFLLTGDKTATYTVGMRIRATGTTPFTIFGTITGSTFSSPNTSVTVSWDSGSMNATLNTVALNYTQAAIDMLTLDSTLTMSGAVINEAKGADIASASTTNIAAATGNYVVITGTTTITAFGTAQAGAMRFVRFSGILTLTHNATSLILPSGANITTAAGDCAIFVSEGSGNWRCIYYFTQKASQAEVDAGTNDTKFITPLTQRLTPKILGNTNVATTSGTTIDLSTSIPANVRRINIAFDQVSTNGTDNWLLQLGDSGGYETSGYLGSAGSVETSSSAFSNFTTGFGIRSGLATNVLSGIITLIRTTGNTWIAQGAIGSSAAGIMFFTSGSKTLSDVLTSARLTTTGGTNTWDSGSVTLSWEF